MALQRTPANSPVAGDEEKLDTVDQAAIESVESSATNDDTQASSAEPSSAAGERAAEKLPTALDKLREKLVAVAPEDDATKVADVPETTPETDAEPTEIEAQAEIPEAVTDETADDNPLHGFTDKEVKHPSNKGMVTRIRDLALERKKLKQQVQKLEPVREAGEFLAKFQADEGFTPDEVAASLALSAAYKRGDPKTIEILEASAAQLRADLGIAEPVKEPALTPFKGVLPQEYQDMVSVLGFSEADVRLFAALQAKPKQAPVAPPAPRVAPVAPQRQQSIQPDPRARLAQLATAANDTVLDYLETVKVTRDQAAKHMSTNLWPYLKPLSPGGDPRQIAPEERLRLVQLAQQKFTLARAKAAIAERAKNPPQPKPTATVPSTPAKPMSELDKLKLRKVGHR